MKIVELKPVSKNKIGRVNLNGAHLEAHEYETILFLNLFGFDIDVILPTNTPKSHNPDLQINGAFWESKSPEGESKYNIQRKIHEASHQADRLVLDLRRSKISSEKAYAEAIKRFGDSKRIKHMLLVTKDKRLLDIRK